MNYLSPFSPRFKAPYTLQSIFQDNRRLFQSLAGSTVKMLFTAVDRNGIDITVELIATEQISLVVKLEHFNWGKLHGIEMFRPFIKQINMLVRQEIVDIGMNVTPPVKLTKGIGEFDWITS